MNLQGLHTQLSRAGRLWLAALLALTALALVVANADRAYADGAPSAFAVSPTSGPSGGGTVVTITGAGFQDAATVKFAGTAATDVIFDGPTRLRATTPPGTPGFPVILVMNPDGQSTTLSNAFRYLDVPPTVKTVSPASGPSTGATQVTINGSGFVAGVTVTIGGLPASNINVSNSTTITAFTPPHAAGGVDVVVKNPDGQSGLLSLGYTYTPAAPPSVTGVSPSSGVTSGGTTVTISGSGFVAGATVTFDGVAATSVTLANNSTITAVTPAHAAGAVTVVVRNPDGQSGALANGFSYVAGPSISGINPSSGPTAGNTAVMISGSGFVAGAAVSIGGAPASNVVVVSPTKITANTPARPIGPATVVVTNPGGLSVSLVNGFTYVDRLAISGVSPATGPTAGGTRITINGSGFVPGSTVLVGGKQASGVTFVSSSQLIATTPKHEADTVNVRVITPKGAEAVARDVFTYHNLHVTRLGPTAGPVEGGTKVEIRGEGFARDVVVLFDGVPAFSVEVNRKRSKIEARTPPHPAGVVDVTIINPGGVAMTLDDAFRYEAAPLAVGRLSPSSGPTAGGGTVTIEGSGFQAGMSVHFGDTPGLQVQVLSPRELRVVAPPHAAGTVSLVLRMADGRTVNAGSYVYQDATGRIIGSVPSTGFGLVVFTGGTSNQLVEAAAPSCPVSRLFVFATNSGSVIPYIPGTLVGSVNAGWHALFGGGIPANQPLLVLCR